jgi:hypothetical protein
VPAPAGGCASGTLWRAVSFVRYRKYEDSARGAIVETVHRMKVSRLLAATIPGIAYPSLLAFVVAGVFTFTVTRVFAEAASLPSCSEPQFTECSTEMAECASCGASNCGCLSSVCALDGGKTEPAFRCADLDTNGTWTCEHPSFAACVGKANREGCGTGKHCVPSGGCVVLDAGFWVRDEAPLVCVDVQPDAPYVPYDAPYDPDASYDAANQGNPAPLDAGNGAGTTPSFALPESSGCSLAAPSTTTSMLASSSLTFAVAMLWRLRRRRR